MPATGAQEGSGPGPSASRARPGVTLLFGLLGIGNGSFASRLPAVKADLHLSAGSLGLALVGPAVGLLISTPLTGWALGRVAPRTWIAIGLLPLSVMLPVASYATTAVGLLAALVVFGVGAGMVDVSMNTEASRVQVGYGRPIMSGIHATYSIGALAGALLGAALAGAGVGVRTQWTATQCLVALAGAVAVSRLPGSVAHHDADGPGPAPGPALPPAPAGRSLRRPLLALAFVCFACFLSEGAATDWSAVYVRGPLGASQSVAAMAYAVFAGTMVLGRLGGDRVTARFGPVRVVRCAATLGAVGLAVALLVGRPAPAVAGFALLGVGLAVGVPLAITAAAGLGRAGSSVAIVTSCGYAGLLLGPPTVGVAADAVGLRLALGLIVVLLVALVALAGALRTRPGVAPAPVTPWGAGAAPG